jgi:hypothetical protein
MSVDYSIANIVIVVWDVEDVEIAMADRIEVGMCCKDVSNDRQITYCCNIVFAAATVD